MVQPKCESQKPDKMPYSQLPQPCLIVSYYPGCPHFWFRRCDYPATASLQQCRQRIDRAWHVCWSMWWYDIFFRFNNSLVLQLENNLPHALPNKYSFYLWSLDNKETMFWPSLQPSPCPPPPKNWLFPMFCRLLSQPGHCGILSAKDTGSGTQVCKVRLISRC